MDKFDQWFTLLVSSLSVLPLLIMLPFVWILQDKFGYGIIAMFCILTPTWFLCIKKLDYYGQQESETK